VLRGSASVGWAVLFLIAFPGCTLSAQRKEAMKSKTMSESLPGAEAFDEKRSMALKQAYAEKGSEYRPRTEHVHSDGAPKFTNRLIQETSPYLLQHAHNPVNWFPWGEEAFAEATRLNRPILLSVGYATCHWCHVMERESFEDIEIATFLNQHFVSIKVDREERPDIDDVYMTAVQMMTGRGGWPMTVVMTPNQQPFFGGTYFPPRDGVRGAGMGFLTLLTRLSANYQHAPGDIAQVSERILQGLREATARDRSQGFEAAPILHAAAASFRQAYDPIHGGFGQAPKFPRPAVFEFLLRYGQRSGDPAYLRMVTHSLHRMIAGGIHDQIGGGFHRYSTDAEWLVPHFEKMLYDNAQLVSVFVEAYQASEDPAFLTAARRTLDYVLKEMTHPDGAFYSATDADSEGHEGRFFVWTPDEVRAAVGPEAANRLMAYYHVSERGDVDGRSVLRGPADVEAVAKQLGLSENALKAHIGRDAQLLYEARKKRESPLLDDKIITEWNAQMISAMARTAFVSGDSVYGEAAARAARFILAHLAQGDRLLRTFRQGRARHAGVLEDYAFFVAALLDLFERTGGVEWLDHAERFQGAMQSHFLDADAGGFFATADDAEALLIRPKPFYDGAQPSGNSVAILNLLRLHQFTENSAYRDTAARALHAFAASMKNGPVACPKLLTALDYATDRAKEIVVLKSAKDHGAELTQILRQAFLPSRVVVVADEGELESLQERLPFLAHKQPLQGKATAFVCYEGACERPTSDPVAFRTLLLQVEPLPSPK
jgi:uncharacterized protein